MKLDSSLKLNRKNVETPRGSGDSFGDLPWRLEQISRYVRFVSSPDLIIHWYLISLGHVFTPTSRPRPSVATPMAIICDGLSWSPLRFAHLLVLLFIDNRSLWRHLCYHHFWFIWDWRKSYLCGTLCFVLAYVLDMCWSDRRMIRVSNTICG